LVEDTKLTAREYMYNLAPVRLGAGPTRWPAASKLQASLRHTPTSEGVRAGVASEMPSLYETHRTRLSHAEDSMSTSSGWLLGAVRMDAR